MDLHVTPPVERLQRSRTVSSSPSARPLLPSAACCCPPHPLSAALRLRYIPVLAKAPAQLFPTASARARHPTQGQDP